MIKTPAEADQKYDYVVCAHKAVDQDSAVKAVEPVIDQDRTTVVIIQNGVGNEEPFRKAYPRVTIISCVVRIAMPHYHPQCHIHAIDQADRPGRVPIKPSPA